MAASTLEQALIAHYGALCPVAKPVLLRSDDQLVFTSRNYTASVRGCGLCQEFITLHRQRQNDIVERMIRTLKERCVQQH